MGFRKLFAWLTIIVTSLASLLPKSGAFAALNMQ